MNCASAGVADRLVQIGGEVLIAEAVPLAQQGGRRSVARPLAGSQIPQDIRLPQERADHGLSRLLDQSRERAQERMQRTAMPGPTLGIECFQRVFVQPLFQRRPHLGIDQRDREPLVRTVMGRGDLRDAFGLPRRVGHEAGLIGKIPPGEFPPHPGFGAGSAPGIEVVRPAQPVLRVDEHVDGHEARQRVQIPHGNAERVRHSDDRHPLTTLR